MAGTYRRGSLGALQTGWSVPHEEKTVLLTVSLVKKALDYGVNHSPSAARPHRLRLRSLMGSISKKKSKRLPRGEFGPPSGAEHWSHGVRTCRRRSLGDLTLQAENCLFSTHLSFMMRLLVRRS